MCPRWQVRSHTSDPSCSYLLICVGTNQNTRGSCGSIKLKTGSSKRAWLYGNLSSNLKLNTDVWRICTHNQYLGYMYLFWPTHLIRPKKSRTKTKKKHESCIKKDKSKQSYGKNQTITKQQGSQTSSLTNTI